MGPKSADLSLEPANSIYMDLALTQEMRAKLNIGGGPGDCLGVMSAAVG